MNIDYANIQDWQEELYKDLHRNPELSFEETRTAGIIEEQLAGFGYGVQRIGGGVVGVLKNGDGPVVLFRADIDGLPVEEDSGLDYASEKPGVMHACGHDSHIACALGAARILSERRDGWAGTHIALFQPAEETGSGARAMVQDGLVDKVPKPDVALGQHVMPGAAGTVSLCAGAAMSQAVSMKVTVFGKGSHGSMPHLGVDPVVLASSIVLRLQTVVSRELAPSEFGVITVGSLHAGAKSNVIPDRAELLLNIRTYSADVHERIIAAVERIVRGECAAAGSPTEPTFEQYDHFPLTDNDEAATARVKAAFTSHFGTEKVLDMEPSTGSEDFSNIPDAWGVPYLYWIFGGFDADAAPIPNHNPKFAPIMQPTLQTGTEAAVVGMLEYLGKR